MPNVAHNFDDSIGKKIARLRFWQTAKKRLGQRFLKGKHLILTGFRAADVGVLLCMGVKLENIVAVDKNSTAANSAKLHWPKLEVHEGDVLDIIREEQYQDSLVTCYADYCANLCDDILEKTAVIAAEGLQTGGIIGVTMFAGRENNESMRRNIIRIKRQQEDHGKDKTLASYTARAAIISKGLIGNTRVYGNDGFVPKPIEAHYYQNQSYNPMILWIGESGKSRATAHSLATDIDLQFVDGQLEVLSKEAIPMGRGVELITNAMLRTNNTLMWRRTIAAWRAHVTRGTYSK